MDEQTRYQEAKRRVEEIKGFYFHLLSYLLVNAVLVSYYSWLFRIWQLMGKVMGGT
jgi:hypothetical protein